MTAAEPAAETWTAMGTRVLTDGKRAEAFRDLAGQVTYWPGRDGFVIGGQYEVRVSRDADGGVTRHGRPVYLGGADDPETAAWEVAAEAAERRLARAAAERRDRRKAGAIDEACAPLCELAASLRNFEDVDRLLASVKRRVYDVWGSK